MVNLLNDHNLYNIVKGNTRFKGEGFCIDLVLTYLKY